MTVAFAAPSTESFSLKNFQLLSGCGKVDIAETVETIQIIAVAAQIPKVISISIKLVQIHAVMMQRFRQIAKAVAKIRPV